MNKEKFKGIIIGIAFTITFSLFTVSPFADSIAKHIRVFYPNVNIVVNNKTIVPKDSKGKVVEPFIYNDTTYLPIRAIGEALNKEVNWDQKTKTVTISEKTAGKDSNASEKNILNPQDFIKKHKVLGDRDFVSEGKGTIKINNANFDYENRVFGPLDFKAFYNVDRKYSKIRGVLVHGDKGEGMYGHNFIVNGDGKQLFKGSEYLKSKGYKNGSIPTGDKGQPIEFEIDISNISLLEFDFGYYATIYNLQFIK